MVIASPEATRARRWRLDLTGVFLLAFAVRLAPLLRTGSLTGVLGVDDGSYYSASAQLLRGLFPYRDFAFDQSPGITVVLLPFTAIATMASDPVGLAAARLGIMILGAANAVLVTLLLRRFASPWAVVGGLLYAVWRLPAAAERTTLLEPILAAGLLGVLLLLASQTGKPDASRVAASGVLAGLTVAITIWMTPATLLIAGYLLITRTARTAAVWIGGAITGFAALAGPLIVAAPASFARQAVHDQLFSGTGTTMSERLSRFSDLVRIGTYTLPKTIDVMVATCVVVGLVAMALTAWWQRQARLPVLLMGLQCALVIAAPDYGYQRFAAVPTLVIVMVAAGHWLAPRPWAGRAGLAMGTTTALVVAGLGLTAVHNVAPRQPDLAQLRAFAAAHQCVWFDTASQAITADALTPGLLHRCPMPVDRLADLRARDLATDGTPQWQIRHSPSFQLHLQAQLRDADSAVVPTDLDDGVLGEAAHEILKHQFTAVGTSDSNTLWERLR